ncbi:MAG: hypothetical protein Q8914_01325 [Bacteroidota bacterium]|nr:hypothetical protein [Bacteroidota bacterium]
MKPILRHVFFLSSLLIATFQAFSSETAVSDKNGNEFELTDAMQKNNTLGAYFGYTQIDDKSFIGMRLQPDLHIGKAGIGLDIPVMFNTATGEFRTDEYKDGIGWLRLINYLSWGEKKQDDLYVKIGDISGAYLGYGMLINNYSNSISYEKRKVGFEADYCWKDVVGMEVVYSDLNLSSFNLLGLRPYVRPLGFTGIPIIKTWDIGLNLVTDHDNTAPMAASDQSSSTNHFLGTGGGMNGYALDMGITLLNIQPARLVVFGSGAMLAKNTCTNFKQALADSINTHANSAFAEKAGKYSNGYGISVGIDFRFKLLANLLRMDTRVERMWYTDNFIPQFFDYCYEVNKDARIMSLVSAEQKAGIYGDLGFSVIQKVRVSGSLMLPDHLDESNPALIRLNLDASNVIDKVILAGSYIKGGLTRWNDAFKLDDRSQMYVRAAYKVLPFVITGVDYRWSWATNSEGKFVPTSHWTPFVGLNLDLPFLDR